LEEWKANQNSSAFELAKFNIASELLYHMNLIHQHHLILDEECIPTV